MRAPARGWPGGGLVSASDKRKNGSDGESGRKLGAVAGRGFATGRGRGAGEWGGCDWCE